MGIADQRDDHPRREIHVLHGRTRHQCANNQADTRHVAGNQRIFRLRIDVCNDGLWIIVRVQSWQMLGDCFRGEVLGQYLGRLLRPDFTGMYHPLDGYATRRKSGSNRRNLVDAVTAERALRVNVRPHSVTVANNV